MSTPLAAQLGDQVLARDQLDPLADGRQQLEDRRLGPGGDQPLGRLAAGRAAADDRDPLARLDRDPPVQYLLRVEHRRRPRRPGSAESSGSAPTETITTSGSSASIVAAVTSVPGCDAHAELDDRARLVVAEVEHRLLARCARGDVELAAELGLPVPDRDVVAAQAGDPRRLHPRRAGADHHHAPRRRGRRDDPVELVADLGVDRAPRLLGPGDEIDARVAGDARTDVVAAPAPDLLGPVGVGDQAASDGDQVGVARRERPLGEVGIVEPAGGDHRHATPPP